MISLEWIAIIKQSSKVDPSFMMVFIWRLYKGDFIYMWWPKTPVPDLTSLGRESEELTKTEGTRDKVLQHINTLNINKTRWHAKSS